MDRRTSKEEQKRGRFGTLCMRVSQRSYMKMFFDKRLLKGWGIGEASIEGICV